MTQSKDTSSQVLEPALTLPNATKQDRIRVTVGELPQQRNVQVLEEI